MSDCQEYLFIGKYYLESKQYEKSAHILLKTIECVPGNVEAYRLLGLAFSGLRLDKHSIEIYNQIILLDGGDDLSYLKSGVAHYYLNLLTQEEEGGGLDLLKTAISYLNRSIELNPCAQAYLFRGKCWNDLPFWLEVEGDEEEVFSAQTYYDYAIADFEKSLELNPKDPEVHIAFAAIYEDDVEIKEAYHLQRAVQLNSNYKKEQVALGNMYCFFGDPQSLDFFKNGFSNREERNWATVSEEQKIAKNEYGYNKLSSL